MTNVYECPNCHGLDCESDVDFGLCDDENIVQKATCLKCDAHWLIYWKPSYQVYKDEVLI